MELLDAVLSVAARVKNSSVSTKESVKKLAEAGLLSGAGKLDDDLGKVLRCVLGDGFSVSFRVVTDSWLFPSLREGFNFNNGFEYSVVYKVQNDKSSYYEFPFKTIDPFGGEVIERVLVFEVVPAV